MTRESIRIGELDVFETATVNELETIGDVLRQEEREQGEYLKDTADSRLAAYAMYRRTAAVYHNGVLMAVGALMDMEDGTRYLTLERSVECLKPGHRFAWLRGFGKFVSWARTSDDEMGGRGRFFTVSPVDYPSAIRLYCRHGGAVLSGVVTIAGREHYLFVFPQVTGDGGER